MALATRVSFGSSAFNSNTTPKTVSVTVNTGDILVAMAFGANATTPVTTAPTGGSISWTQISSQGSGSSQARGIGWHGTSGSNQTFSVSCVRPATNTDYWGCMVWVYRDSDGVGALAGNIAVSNTITLTTTQANSTLLVGSGDWNAVDGASRTRRTVNGSTGTEELYGRDSAQYSWYGQRYDDAGSIGSVTGGYSAPSGQASAIIAVEIKGTTGGGGPAPRPPTIIGAYTTPVAQASARIASYW
jgi:hypothetical protein